MHQKQKSLWVYLPSHKKCVNQNHIHILYISPISNKYQLYKQLYSLFILIMISLKKKEII